MRATFAQSLAASFCLAWSASFARELTDLLVIFSISLIAYKAIVDWGGIVVIDKFLGIQSEKPSFLYFFGMALVVFSVSAVSEINEPSEQNAWRPSAMRRPWPCAIR